MARGILGKLLNMGMSKTLYSQPQKEAPQQKENRKAYREAAEQAIESGNLEVLQKLIPQMRQVGIDPNLYAVQAGQPTAEQSIQKILNEVMRTGQVAQPPGEGTEAAINLPPGGETERGMRRQMADIFTPEFAMRSALKQLSGIDIGEDAFFKKQFYNEYKALRDANVPHSKAFIQLAAKFGAIPDDASNLKEASAEERRVIFNRRFNNLMADPVFEKTFKEAYPGADEKGKAALIFQEMAKNGEWIDEDAQALVERIQYKMTDTSKFLSAEQSAYAYKLTGKNPADLSPSEVALVVHGANLEKQKMMIEDIKAQEEAKWEIELDKPITPELAKEYNLPVNTKLRDLLNSGEVPVGDEEKAILKAIAGAKRMRATAMRLFKAEGINRFAFGGKRKLEKFLQSNPDLAKWESDRLSFAVRKARADGQKGNLRWEELQPLVSAVPGLWHSRTFAKAYFDGVISEMEQMLAIERQGLKEKQPTLSTGGYSIGESVKGEDGKPVTFKGKDQYGADIWETE